jgi:hypothetical protein
MWVHKLYSNYIIIIEEGNLSMLYLIYLTMAWGMQIAEVHCVSACILNQNLTAPSYIYT